MAQLTRAKLKANKKNAAKSTGPSDTISTRFNAVKHGLLSYGVTELDDLNYETLLIQMRTTLDPEGPLESFLVERICLCMVRLRRAGRLEAEFITSEVNPPITKKIDGQLNRDFSLLTGKTVVIDPGLPAQLSTLALDSLVGKFQRYETAIENKLYRTMNQLERIQRIRLGEKIPAPASLDIDVHMEKETLASFGNP